VRKACLEGFERVITLLGQQDMLAALEGYGAEPAEYDAFIEKFCPFLVKYFPDQMGLYIQALIAYFRSSWPVIRGNAAICVGNLVRNVPQQGRRRLDLTDVCAALMGLLNEPTALVRSKGAKALSFLHDV